MKVFQNNFFQGIRINYSDLNKKNIVSILMIEYWSVVDKNTGKKLCDCWPEKHAKDLVAMDPHNRFYIKNHFLKDQVIDITYTVDKTLSGQIGLPEGKEKILQVSNWEKFNV